MNGPLNSEHRAEFTLRLKRRYRDLWNDVQRELNIAIPYAELAGDAHDLEDAASADLLVDLNLADIHRDIVEMRAIDAALKRLVADEYGSCSDCGEEIPLPRLRAYPIAERCLECQQRHEKTHMPERGASF